jgi:histidine triad (HIT) family protein
MSECIFCKIVAGEVPCYKVWEDEYILAFLDIGQVSEGHTLVIPKNHFENVFDADDEILEKLNIVCKKIAIKLKEKLNVDGVNIVNASGKEAQQSVFHLHFHVVPRNKGDGLDLWFHGKKEKRDLSETAKKIRE